MRLAEENYIALYGRRPIGWNVRDEIQLNRKSISLINTPDPTLHLENRKTPPVI